MPIPKTREDLVDSMESAFAKLSTDLDRGEETLGVERWGSLHAVDAWSVKDLLAVRLWWTESVVAWIEAGRRGERPITPADGYGWSETPRLNQDIVDAARARSYTQIRGALDRGYRDARALADDLDDEELLGTGAFAWAGKYPLARWLSINTTRQYTTARSYVRKALREATA